MTWKMGPECAAQHAKKVNPRIRKCFEVIASLTFMPAGAVPTGAPAGAGGAVGGRLTKKDAGTSSAHAIKPMINMTVRQSVRSSSHVASGEMVTGATPTPAETSDTARLRRVSNQPVTAAIIGAKNALTDSPMRKPNVSWKCSSEVARDANTSARPRSTAPMNVTMRGPTRSLTVPQRNEPNASTRKLMVIAAEMPARDHSVVWDIGVWKTASENSAPMDTQPMSAPIATMTQR